MAMHGTEHRHANPFILRGGRGATCCHCQTKRPAAIRRESHVSSDHQSEAGGACTWITTVSCSESPLTCSWSGPETKTVSFSPAVYELVLSLTRMAPFQTKSN